MSATTGLVVELRQDAPMPLDAAFSCAPGEVLALVGPSGSGKSTILRSIAGAWRPAEGRIEVNGQPWFDSARRVSRAPHRRRVGMVFQSYALFPHMTALGNVMAAMTGLPVEARARKAQHLLDLVHLDGLGQRRPAELSGGEQQRVAVARALGREPEVLLLDEPFSAVDKSTRKRLYREIAELRRVLNMPVVLVTHDLDEATMLADRMAVLHRGRTLQIGTPDDVTTRPRSAEVAQLVDLQNVFAGVVIEQRPEAGATVIEAHGCRFAARYDAGFVVGDVVSWVVPDGYVVLHRGERAAAHDNAIHGRIDTVLIVGPSAQLEFTPSAGLPVLRFSVAAHVARRHGFAAGVSATVSLLAEGIHLMRPDDEPRPRPRQSAE